MVLNTVSKPPLVTSYFASLNNRPSDIVLPFFLLFLSDKTFRFYKSSVASASGRSTPARGFSFDVMRPNAEPQTQTQTQASSQTMMTKDGKEAWEVDMEGSSLPESESRFSFFLFFVLSSGDSRRERKDGGFFLCFFLVFPWVILYIWAGPKSCCGDHLLICVMVLVSPLPVIKNAAESERVAADSRMDRMTIWMRNVESKFILNLFYVPSQILNQNHYRGRRRRQAKLRRRLVHNERSPAPRSTSSTLAYCVAEPHVQTPTSGTRCQPDLPGG